MPVNAGTDLVPEDLRCEYLTNPLGIDSLVPRLSWRLRSDRRGARQRAYLIRVHSLPASGLGHQLWDSGRVESGDFVHIDYEGPVLASRDAVTWTVEVTDEFGSRVTSEPATWEMGLLTSHDWAATWIGRPSSWPHGVDAPTTLFRRDFSIDEPVLRARLYITSLGIHEARCNGVRIGDTWFAPGWTDYHHRLQYEVHDLTSTIVEGQNAVAVELVDGWYAGHVGFLGREIYGRDPQLLAQIVIEHLDGRSTVVATDDRWEIARGWRRTDLLMGERVDQRDAPIGWDCPGIVPDERWSAASLTVGTDVALVAMSAPPTRVVDLLDAVTVTPQEAGGWIFDIGQNIAGWARLRVSGQAGVVVTMRFAEVLDEDGTLYVENLRTAAATDEFVLTGEGIEVLEPKFTFHGFRYVEVAGAIDPLWVGDLTGVVCATDVDQTGSFRCSDEAVNQLQHNIEWGQRGNFLEVPTDCPQRDERLGWTGDAQVFGATAVANADVAAFLARWTRDLVAGQSADGAFPVVVPRLEAPSPDETWGAPGWGDAGVIVPWLIYERYGDRRFLAECFPAMAAWVGYVHDANPDLLWRHRRHGDMGDWLSIDADSPKDVVATSYFAWSAELLARSSAALGLDRAPSDRELADLVAAAYRDAFVSADGRIDGDTQTIYALALRFGLLEPSQWPRVVDRLVDDIEARGWHLSTGFLGVAHLLPALTDAGRVDVAYRLLHQDTCPSWLYPVAHGATTIWERWDGWTAEHGFADPAMNSFNHYAFGAVGEWLYESVGGIRVDPSAPGYQRVIIEPHPGGNLTWAEARCRTIRGEIAVRWERSDDRLSTSVTIPPGVEAELRIPADPGGSIDESGRPIWDVDDLVFVGQVDGRAVITAASGRYCVETRMSASGTLI